MARMDNLVTVEDSTMQVEEEALVGKPGCVTSLCNKIDAVKAHSALMRTVRTSWRVSVIRVRIQESSFIKQRCASILWSKAVVSMGRTVVTEGFRNW